MTLVAAQKEASKLVLDLQERVRTAQKSIADKAKAKQDSDLVPAMPDELATCLAYVHNKVTDVADSGKTSCAFFCSAWRTGLRVAVAEALLAEGFDAVSTDTTIDISWAE